MVQFKTKDDILRHVRKLKNFYGEFSVFVLMLSIALIIYNLSDGEHAWVLFMLITWGMTLFLKASKLSIISHSYYKLAHDFRESLPFIKKNWESEKTTHLLSKLTPHAPSPLKKSSPPKKNVRSYKKKSLSMKKS